MSYERTDLDLGWGEEPPAPVAFTEPIPEREHYWPVWPVMLAALIGLMLALMLGLAIERGARERRAELDDLRGDISALQQSNVMTGGRLGALETSYTAHDKKLDELRSDIETMQPAIEWLKAQVAPKLPSPIQNPTQTKSTTSKTTSSKTTSTSTKSYNTKGVEQWRPLVSKWVKAYGGSDVNVTQFLSVMRKESGGNPRAVNGSSGTSGLMQIHPCHATKYKTKTGKPYYDGRFDPEANIKFAAYMSNGGRNWSSWSAKP